jgi:peptidoglycan/LPS O-acetylase OafA/YrhL
VSLTLAASDLPRQPSGSRYRPEVDGLRALAVMAVIVNHFSKDLLPSGFLGVDIFFVISGYVITSSLYGHRFETLQHFLLGFYGRRVKRLVPALAACVLLTGVAMCMVNPSPGLSLQTGISALFGFSNIFLYNLSVDYFMPQTELNPFTQTWSLGVEEQFYLVFPLLFWFAGVVTRKPASNFRLALITGILSALSLVGFLFYGTHDPSASYFLMPWRFWEIGSGVLLVVVIDRLRLWRFSIRGLLPLCFLLAICWLFTVPISQRGVSTPGVVLFTSLLMACIRPGQPGHKILAWRPFVAVGLISYSLYLWHWSVLVLSRWTTGLHPWTIPYQIVLVIALSLLSYCWIETPFRRSAWMGSDLGNLLSGLATLGAVAASFIALGVLPGISLYTGKRNGLQMVGQPSLVNSYLPEGASGAGWLGKPCVLTSDQDVDKKIDASQCQLGDVDPAAGQILVIGNSFAAAFTAAFDDMVVNDRHRVTLIAGWGASPVPELHETARYRQANQTFWSKIIPQQISTLRRGDTVFLVNDLFYLSPPSVDATSKRQLAQFRLGLERLSNELKPKGIRLAVLSAIPFAREANCLPDVARQEWFNGFGGPCSFISREQTRKRQQPLQVMLEELRKRKGIIVVDLMPLFCPGSECTYTTSNGVVLYRDSNSHPSVQAARLAGPLIRRALVEQTPREFLESHQRPITTSHPADRVGQMMTSQATRPGQGRSPGRK